ncbi:MAG TPA: EFR1 family ferrodoxin [Smithella sp.]|nr:EFR1 family ferrodoxin [Smithella sp.]
METAIFFYTGTGNSFWTAKKLSALLHDAESVPIALCHGDRIVTDAEKIGFVFPVHIWGLPSPVIDFLNRLEMNPEKFYFAVAVNAGQVAATLIQLEKLLQQKHVKLSLGFSVCLPSNYIPWEGAETSAKQQKKFSATLDKINRIASSVRTQEEKPPERGPLWQNILFSAIYRMTFERVPRMDKPFYADAKCTSCGICEKICPAQNIQLVRGKPAWQHRCEQCFACLQWCPEEAIQYGKGTVRRKRYRHPEITLKEMPACAPGKNR